MYDTEIKRWVQQCEGDSTELPDTSGKTICNVVQVKTDRTRKISLYRHEDLILRPRDRVVVETDRGSSGGTIVGFPSKRWVSTRGLKAVLRHLEEGADDYQQRRYEDREQNARSSCIQLVQQHALGMKVVDVEYVHWENRTIFYFVAEGRVDFRELVKDLSRTLRCRIEMRQIGPRDETKMLGGMGRCGRSHCCSNHLNEFRSVRTKMAKEQGLVVNQEKITGHCRKLLCCLAYEKEVYSTLKKTLPKLGSVVETKEGLGKVVELQPLRQAVRVHLKETGAYKVIESVILTRREGQDEEGRDLPPLLEQKKPEVDPELLVDISAPPEIHESTDEGRDRKRGRGRSRRRGSQGRDDRGRGQNSGDRKEGEKSSDSGRGGRGRSGRKPRGSRQGDQSKGPRSDSQKREGQSRGEAGGQSESGGQKRRSRRPRRRSSGKPKTES